MEERGIPTIAAKRLDGSMPLGKEVGLAPCHIKPVSKYIADGPYCVRWGPKRPRVHNYCVS